MPLSKGYKKSRSKRRSYKQYKHMFHTQRITRKPRLLLNLHRFRRTVNATVVMGNPISTYTAGWTIPSTNSYCMITTAAGFANAVQYFNIALGFQLADLPDSAEFTTLFDSYKITGVLLRLTPISTGASSQYNTAAPYLNTIVHSILDYDDSLTAAASESGVNTMREYASYRTWNMADTRRSFFTRFVRPAVEVQVQNSATSTTAMQTKNRWINCAVPSVNYFGIKLSFEVYTPQAIVYDVNFKIECTYYVQLKDVR